MKDQEYRDHFGLEDGVNQLVRVGAEDGMHVVPLEIVKTGLSNAFGRFFVTLL